MSSEVETCLHFRCQKQSELVSVANEQAVTGCHSPFINTGLQAGDSPHKVEMSRFNGFTSAADVDRARGLRYQHAKAVETA
jgi:hypothetical protein